MSYPPPPQNDPYAAGGAPGVPQTNKKAIWSLVLGILSFFCFGIISGVAAVILGNQAKSEIAASGGAQTGEGLAKAGVICGIIGFVLSVLIIVAFLMG